VFAALLVLAIGTPRSWRRVWRSSKSEPFWQPRTTTLAKILPQSYVNRVRRQMILASLGLILIAFSAQFDALAIPCGIALIAVVIPLWVSIWLFNKPSFLVPPPLRDDPGAFESYRMRRQSHR
jgi:hypothetical protein